MVNENRKPVNNKYWTKVYLCLLKPSSMLQINSGDIALDVVVVVRYLKILVYKLFSSVLKYFRSLHFYNST